MSTISRLLESLALLLIWAIFYGSHLFFVFAVASVFQLVLSPELLPFWAAITLGVIPAVWFLIFLNKHVSDTIGVVANLVIISIMVLISFPILMRVKEKVLKRSKPSATKMHRAS